MNHSTSLNVMHPHRFTYTIFNGLPSTESALPPTKDQQTNQTHFRGFASKPFLLATYTSHPDPIVAVAQLSGPPPIIKRKGKTTPRTKSTKTTPPKKLKRYIPPSQSTKTSVARVQWRSKPVSLSNQRQTRPHAQKMVIAAKSPADQRPVIHNVGEGRAEADMSFVGTREQFVVVMTACWVSMKPIWVTT